MWLLMWQHPYYPIIPLLRIHEHLRGSVELWEPDMAASQITVKHNTVLCKYSSNSSTQFSHLIQTKAPQLSERVPKVASKRASVGGGGATTLTRLRKIRHYIKDTRGIPCIRPQSSCTSLLAC